MLHFLHIHRPKHNGRKVGFSRSCVVDYHSSSIKDTTTLNYLDTRALFHQWLIHIIVHECWCAFRQSRRGNDPFMIKSPPEGSAIQFRCFRNPVNSPPGMYKKRGNIMEQKLPTSLNLNMVSWTRISCLHQQQQYLDLASKHSEVNTVSTWTGAEGSIDPWMLLSEAEEQLFPRWAWKMVPYILYMYIYIYMYI